MQLQLPGSTWSAPVLIEAAGTHGLLEIEAASRGPPAWPAEAAGGAAAAAAASLERHGHYQLGLSINSCPGVFGRSKMLTVAPRVLLRGIGVVWVRVEASVGEGGEGGESRGGDGDEGGEGADEGQGEVGGEGVWCVGAPLFELLAAHLAARPPAEVSALFVRSH